VARVGGGAFIHILCGILESLLIFSFTNKMIKTTCEGIRSNTFFLLSFSIGNGHKGSLSRVSSSPCEKTRAEIEEKGEDQNDNENH
jgi:hypothetical protein